MYIRNIDFDEFDKEVLKSFENDSMTDTFRSMIDGMIYNRLHCWYCIW